MQNHESENPSNKRLLSKDRDIPKKASNKNGKIIFAFSFVTSLIAAGFGFNYMNENDLQLKNSKDALPAKSLKFFQHSDEIAMNDVSDLHEKSYKTEIDPYQRNNELKEELRETRDRLKQLKNDILIRGGSREAHYKDVIVQLESSLEDAEEEIRLLRNELQDRTTQIQSQFTEAEEVNEKYLEENEQLRQKLENSFKEYEYDLENSRDALDKFIKEMKLTDDEKRSFQYIEETLDAIKGKIISLENELKDTIAKLDLEKEKVKNLSASLLEQEKKNYKANIKINSLLTQLKEGDEKYAILEKALDESVITAYSSTKPLTDMDQIKIRLTGQEARALVLEHQLLSEIGQKKSAREQALALEEELSIYKGSNSTTRAKKPLTEQEKIIEDLSHSLELSEKRNLEIQQKLDDQTLKANNPSKDDYEFLKGSINKRMQDAQSNIDEIEAEFVDSTSSTDYDNFLIEDTESQEEIKVEKMKLERAIDELNNKIEMQKRSIEEKDKKIQELMKSQNISNEKIDFQTSVSQEELFRFQKLYETEIKNLKNELQKTKHEFSLFQSNAIANNEEFPSNTIQILQNALKAQTEALLAAQEEILRVDNEMNLNQKEEYYLSKIKQLTEKNRILENRFSDAEEYLYVAEEQMIDDQQKNINLKSIMNEKDQKIAYLEQELASLESGDPSIYYNRFEEEKRLQDQLSRLNEALNKERNRRSSIENEVALLREELIKQNLSELDSNTYTASVSLEEFEEKKSEVAELEERLVSMMKWNESLQNELAAHELKRDFNTLLEKNIEIDPSVFTKLQSEVVYLTKRVEQEKDRYQTLEEKIKEMGITFFEMQQRNNLLEKKLRQAGLKSF